MAIEIIAQDEHGNQIKKVELEGCLIFRFYLPMMQILLNTN